MKSVSVVMAAYNGERFIREQMDSILVQSYPIKELIIQDDCSTDSTLQIVAEYAKMDNRIKVFRNEKNLGFLKYFESACLMASGDYVALRQVGLECSVL